METGTTTLAESLLEDLDDLSEGGEEEKEKQDDEEEQSEEIENSSNGQQNKMIVEDDDAMECESTPKPNGKIRKLLLDDVKLKQHLSKIQSEIPQTTPTAKEEAEQHHLIIESNKWLSRIDTELIKARDELCTAYEPKFPELEELLIDPHQYKNAVRVIGNEMDLTKIHDELNGILSSNQIITISVAGSTSSGRKLSEEEMERVQQAMQYMDGVAEVQNHLVQFVESRMEHLAPNVCVLVGATVAARLLGMAGGLSELSKIPACNLQVLGRQKTTSSARAGMSALHSKPHMGILSESDLVARTPKHLQKKALKILANKLALAARCDFSNVECGRERSADAGRAFRAEIEGKITKWEEPDKAPVIKALPKPDLTTKKRRGGKRIRRLKERFEETELMKQANKRSFSSAVGEYGDDAMGLTMGMLDTKDAATGHLRTGMNAETKKLRVANTKASRKRAAQMAAAGSSTTLTSGLASSMVFTPVQGLELVNPDANKEKVQNANRKWFSEDTGFQSALPKPT